MSGDLENVWDQREVRDPTTHHLLSYAGLECRVLGTFYGSDLRGGTGVGHVLTFGSDLSNYYHTHGLKVFTPRCDALERIVNYRDPRTHADAATAMVSVGAVRYASSHRAFQQVDGLAVSMTPTALLGQKTALFGMTRTGKSNTTKIVLKTIFELRW